MNVVELGQT